MRHRLLPILPIIALAFVARGAGAQAGEWSIDQKPTLVLGDAGGDANVLFGAGLVGATRLPDGRILVADRGDFSLKLFGTDGKFIKYLGRKGSGPGEFDYLAKLFRCGDRIAAHDIGNGSRVAIFDLQLNFLREFHYGTSATTHRPYTSACNVSGTWVHYGWEDRTAMKPGMFRGMVDAWTTGMDSAVKVSLGKIPGSERWGQTSEGRLVGTRPMPLGKQSVIAIGADRIFIGTADSYEIGIFDLEGKSVGTIRKSGANLATTKADIDFAMQREQAGKTDAERARVADAYAKLEFPKTVPAYTKMLVDAEGLVWVQEFPRAKSAVSMWAVFSPVGAQRSTVLLPTNLDVVEIGSDYVLGKFIDPDEQIPQVHLYRLHRTR